MLMLMNQVMKHACNLYNNYSDTPYWSDICEVLEEFDITLMIIVMVNSM